MVGRLTALLLAATGAVAQMVSSSGGTETINVSGQATIIIIATNAGGGASWQNVNPPMASTSAAPQTHQVTVGGGTDLVYTPNTINAAVGDYVQFNFMNANHTVTQSSFTSPCVNAGMFDSGFMPNKDNTINPPPAMKLQVNSTSPQCKYRASFSQSCRLILMIDAGFYCKQKTPTPHCGKGMTFSINPTADKTQAMFQAMAIQQNGTSSGTPPPASAAPPAPPAATTAAAPPPAASVASGTGTTDGSGACSCSCLCGVASFPDAVQQGLGNFGGMSGALPASNAETQISG